MYQPNKNPYSSTYSKDLKKSKDLENSQNAQAAEKPAKKKEPPETGNKWNFSLMAGGVVFAILSFRSLIRLFSGHTSFLRFATLLFITAGCFAVNVFLNKRAEKFSKYKKLTSDGNVFTVAELKAATGLPENTIRRDLNYMCEHDYFKTGAYFDVGLDSLVMSLDDAEKERMKRVSAGEIVAKREAIESNPRAAVLNELYTLSNDIVDPGVSADASKLYELTAEIFKKVDECPEKEPQIRKFESYYLPSTTKLLKSYYELEHHKIGGANITSSKQEIERILKDLVKGFENQLDRLYGEENLDISSDVDVLETMLERDGLKGGGI